SPLSIDTSVAGVATIRGSAFDDQVNLSQAAPDMTLTDVNPNHRYWDYSVDAFYPADKSVTKDVSNRKLVLDFSRGDQLAWGPLDTAGKDSSRGGADYVFNAVVKTSGGNVIINASTIPLLGGAKFDTTNAALATAGVIILTATDSITLDSGAQLIAAIKNSS